MVHEEFWCEAWKMFCLAATDINKGVTSAFVKDTNTEYVLLITFNYCCENFVLQLITMFPFKTLLT